jgi:hypothetical protein
MLKAVRNLVRAKWPPSSSSSESSKNAGGIEDEIRNQRAVLDSWKGKCESQLNMLAVCKSTGAFETVPTAEKAYDCPFVVTNSYRNGSTGYYVTPTGCLVYYNGAFYDPCRHASKLCTSPLSKVQFTLEEITASLHTLVKFDVRSTSSEEILGTWPIKFYDRDEGKNEVAAQVVERILRWQASSSSSSTEEDLEFETENLAEVSASRGANIPWRLSKGFIDEIFASGGSSVLAKGSVGNTKTQPSASFPTKGWGSAEGLVTGGSAAEFCDSISDWWPDVSGSHMKHAYI